MASALALTAATCGGKTGAIEVVAISEPTSTDGDPKVAGRAVTAFGAELLREVRGDDNVVVSPLSVAIALAMLEPGATGAAQTELRRALHVEDPAAFHASMTALRRSLESAKAPQKRGETDFGELEIAIANATYMQDGYPILDTYLDALGQYYGPRLRTVDFTAEAAAAADDINAFVEQATRGHIKDIVEKLDEATVLALVNALYLKASWLSPFKSADTKNEAFTRLDGTVVQTPLMHGASDASVAGDGWVAARKAYSARLAADFVLPDAPRFDEVANTLGAIFGRLETPTVADGAMLVAPKLVTRFKTELRATLQALGIRAPYEPGHLVGIAEDPDGVVLDQALHATFLAMDEEGTEAAAATVLTFVAVGAPVDQPDPVPVVLDRPFFFRIVDTETGATLFIGQVLDPTAG